MSAGHAAPVRPLEPIAEVRERTIASLGRHFAQDHITLDELERRLERAYRTSVPAELVALTHDLPAVDAGSMPMPGDAVAPLPRAPRSGLGPDHRRMLNVMSSKKCVGYWEPPRRLDVASVMSETVLDFTAARMHDEMELSITAVMAQVRIIVPEGTRVIEDVSALMAEVGNDAPWDGHPHAGPLLRIHGTAFMAEVKVRLAPRRGRPQG